MKEPAKATPETLAAIEALLDRRGPLLIEAAFPGMATSSDWYLLDTIEEIRALIERLHGGAVLHIDPVWDLKNSKESGMSIKA